jgi:hypothetical protein
MLLILLKQKHSYAAFAEDNHRSLPVEKRMGYINYRLMLTL